MLASRSGSQLTDLLPIAEQHGYAVGSFAPRYRAMIAPVLRAGQATRSPLIVQISQKEFQRFRITPAQFAQAFRRQMAENAITVPVALHLDHTWEFDIIEAAIAAGFGSVMIDASAKELEENIEISAAVVEYAHARGVAVEAELGRILSADRVETNSDEELLTRPQEAARFVRETGVDALAVSVGTIHGVYKLRQPRIDLDRLARIRAVTSVHLVLHGGSGVAPEMMRAAIQLPGGGVSKVNIATDLEAAALEALGLMASLTDAEMSALSRSELGRAQAAVEQTVLGKIERFLGSGGMAPLG
jgi:fructose-bisphosphate aldolase class II